MSAQTCTVGMDAGPFPMFDNNTFGSYVDPNLNAQGNAESLFPYDFLNLDQTTNTAFPNPTAFQTSDIDSSLVVPPAFFNEAIPSTYVPSFQAGHSANIGSEDTDGSPGKSTTAPPISETQNENGVKKRRPRKKKAPLPLAVKEEKRRVFLEKNRKAARKCREKNREKWDRIHEQSVDLEAQNKVWRQRVEELRAEVNALKMLLRKHGKCGDKVIDEWIERHGEFDLESDGLESKMNSSESQRERATSAHSNFRSKQGGEMAPPLSLQTEGLSNSQNNDMEFFRAADDDDDVPSLSSQSRKNSASTSSDFDLDFARSAQASKVPSPTDSALDLTADAKIYAAPDGRKQDGFGMGLEDPDDGLFSLSHFTGQEMAPRMRAVMW
jgi:hypothetical protein